LYNLLSRCRGCRRGRCRSGGVVEKPEWRKRMKTVVPGKKIRAPKRVKRQTVPCVFNCNRIHAADIDYYDVLRFEELLEDFEPVDDERFVQRDAIVEVGDDGGWAKIERTAFS
jgi:hypothetical protein